MASHYTVVHYVPDPISDERINVGVLVFGDGRIRSRFLSSWRRVQQFGTGDVSFVRDFASRIEQTTGLQPPIDEPVGREALTETRLRQMIGRWVNSIQFSEPKASLLAPERLLDEMCRRFL